MKKGAYILKCVVAILFLLVGILLFIVGVSGDAKSDSTAMVIIGIVLLVIGIIIITRAASTYKYGKRVKGGGFSYVLKSSEEKEKIKQAKSDRVEAGTTFTGFTAQPIGSIPVNGKVLLQPDPQNQVLMILHKDISISLAYSKIVSFVLDSESKISSGGSTIGRAVLGGALFGSTGAIVGGMSAGAKVENRWVGQLTYKSGDETTVLTFLQAYTGKTKEPSALKFEKMINQIGASHAAKITEL